MVRKIDETSKESWFQRAPAAGGPEAGTNAVTASAVHALADRSKGGWDPREVWLRYIDQPRRLRQLAADAGSRRGG
jgi:hypothetical protein